jgi:hypothetical protein
VQRVLDRRQDRAEHRLRDREGEDGEHEDGQDEPEASSALTLDHGVPFSPSCGSMRSALRIGNVTDGSRLNLCTADAL